MFRCVVSGLAALSFYALPAQAWGQSQPLDQVCFNQNVDQSQDLDRRIAGCLTIIGDNLRSADQRAAAHLRRGLAYLQRTKDSKGTDDLERALSDFSETIRLAPGNAAVQQQIRRLRARLYVEIGDYDRAIADYGALLQHDPDSPVILEHRAFVYAMSGDHERAIADYAAAIKLDPKVARFHDRRAWSYLESGKAIDGLADAEEAITLDPNDANIYVTRGLIYRSLGRTTESYGDLRKALALDPSSPTIREEVEKARQYAAAAVPPQPPEQTVKAQQPPLKPADEPTKSVVEATKPIESTKPAIEPSAIASASRSLSAVEETALKPKDAFKDCDTCPQMIVMARGEFVMGSNQADDFEKPERTVTFSTPFAVAKYESTFAEWDACFSEGGCKYRPDDKGWGRGNQPVINVSWDDVTKEYLPWLNQKTGKKYRLLTEAEWEYAARAGTRTPYPWGDTLGQGRANCDGCGSQWDNKQTAPVGSFAENPFGLHDMYGNVWEWVADCYKETYANAPIDGSAVTETPGCSRTRRGASWYNKPDKLRPTLRTRSPSSQRADTYGFRLARVLAQ